MAENKNPARDAIVHTLDQLGEQVVDVLVIGGGIVGAGVARDAALRGFRTALVEQSDFASGTSSRSSRLLHGGMRYLAQGRIGLVYEASREKRVLGRIAAHLAQPLAFIFPGRKGTSWPRWKLAIGAKLYDLLCGMRNFGRSSVLSRGKTLDLLPGLAEVNLTGSVRYFDALTNDARLVIENAVDYADEVQGADQAAVHRGRWATVDEVQQRREADVQRLYAQAAQNAVDTLARQ
jgi:glycerol-3-phosphate dehydrogenase